jgi:hypothetical protein
MGRPKLYLPSKEQREIIAWMGGGLVIAIGGLWTLFVYFYPSDNISNAPTAGTSATAGGIVIGGNATNSRVSTQSTQQKDRQP